ncbi:MAG: hypothetical protein A2156_07555 [Deltaproteobacteria bacterium RBG_16_48_10]|nr:MAG: hypothetical protein A2156_07555 [Deltaproteobacteria bacterium RBG_16_48_10]
MVAYDFYCLDEIGNSHSIGILPERRKDPERITRESVTNWGKLILGEDAHLNHLFYVQVKIDEETGRMTRLSPVR